ncbi:hypothetical protein RJ639_026425, partial [Escallonia herrerae]
MEEIRGYGRPRSMGVLSGGSFFEDVKDHLRLTGRMNNLMFWVAEYYIPGFLALSVALGSKFNTRETSLLRLDEQVDPFSLVADELAILANRLRSMVVAEVPKLASAAEYFFKMGVEGKRFRPTVLLLMATALNLPLSGPASVGSVNMLSTELRTRQQCIAEITEMIHVASLLHDDVLDDADTRRGIGSLNFVMGNKILTAIALIQLAVLAGDFLLSRACVALASLKNTE